MVPWRLGSAGTPPNVEVVVDVGAALGTVLGAETPAKGFRRLVSRQRAGALIARGRHWEGVAPSAPTEGAGTEAEEEGANADSAGMEGVRSGCNKPAGVEQPEGGSKRWWMGRRRCLWGQGWRLLVQQGGRRHWMRRL